LSASLETQSPRGVGLPGFFLTVMPIKLAEEVFLGFKRIMRISGWGKELALAFGAGRHCRHLVLVSQDDEVTFCHGADSLAQFQGVVPV
jgi:hypothetical protein